MSVNAGLEKETLPFAAVEQAQEVGKWSRSRVPACLWPPESQTIVIIHDAGDPRLIPCGSVASDPKPCHAGGRQADESCRENWV